MNKFFLKLNNFFRNLLLDNVDKPYEKPLPYHRKFGSKERQVSDIKHRRLNEQKEQSRGF